MRQSWVDLCSSQPFTVWQGLIHWDVQTHTEFSLRWRPIIVGFKNDIIESLLSRSTLVGEIQDNDSPKFYFIRINFGAAV